MIKDTINGFAQQQYLFAEKGILQAAKDGADYWYIDGSFPEEYPEMWTGKRIDLLIQKIQTYKVKPIFHGNFKLSLSSDVLAIREASVKQVLLEIDLSKELSTPLIVHGGVIVEPRLVIKAKKAALNNYLRSLEKIVSYAMVKGVTILLENLANYINHRPFHYIFTTPEEYRYIFDRIDAPHVHFFYDVGHGAICSKNVVSVIQEFHSKIWGMSFSNNDGIRDLHIGILRGVVDYTQIVNTIIKNRWEGVIAFEARDRSFSQNISDLFKLFEDAYNQHEVI